MELVLPRPLLLAGARHLGLAHIAPPHRGRVIDLLPDVVGQPGVPLDDRLLTARIGDPGGVVARRLVEIGEVDTSAYLVPGIILYSGLPCPGTLLTSAT